MFQDETTLHSLLHSASARFSRSKSTILSISFLWLDTFIQIFDLLRATSFSSNKYIFMNEQGLLIKYFQFSFIFYLHRTNSFSSNQNIFIDRRSTSYYLSSFFWSASSDFIQLNKIFPSTIEVFKLCIFNVIIEIEQCQPTKIKYFHESTSELSVWIFKIHYVTTMEWNS